MTSSSATPLPQLLPNRLHRLLHALSLETRDIVSENASEYDDGEEFDLEAWAAEAENGKTLQPDSIEETSCGWPEGDEEVEYESGDLEESKVPYLDDVADDR